MTLSLWCLAAGCLLPFVWVGFTMPGRLALPGGLDNANPRPQQARLEGIGQRAVAAHQNAWEALPIFTAAVLTAHVAGADPTWSGWLAAGWVGMRVLHGLAYLGNVHILRSLAFVAGLLLAMGQFVLAAQATP